MPEASDKRVQRSKEAVLAQTYRLLSEGGISGVSIDEVSRRSGVSKTTIYRHWPSRSALLLDACGQMGGQRPPAPDTGSLAGDVGLLATHLARQLAGERWAVVLPSIIDAAEHDPELAQVHARLHAGLMEPFVAVLERARQRGELARGQTASRLVAALVGPLFYRRWFSREPLDETFVKALVREVVAQAGA